MAYINPAIDETEQNKFGPTGTTSPSPQGEAPPLDSGSAGSASAGGSAGSAPTQATSTQFGSSASKLSDYLSANAPQIESMGSGIADKLNTQYGQLQGDINKAGSDFGTAVQGGYTQSNPDLVNRAASDPANFVKNVDDIADFKKQLNDSYTGPQNFESFTPYSKVQGDVSNAVQGANLLKSSGGLSSYLQNQSQGQYTPGMNTLDTTLLQANPNAQQMVTDATAPYAGLTDYLNQAAQTANAQVAPAQQAAAGSQQAARNAITNAINAENMNVGTAQTNAQNAITKYNQTLVPEYNNDVSKYLGLVNNPPPNWNSVWNPNVAGQPYGHLAPWYNAQAPITQPISAVNPDAVPSAQNYATEAALSQLAGNTSGLPGMNLNQANASLAGTAKPVPSSVDSSALLAALTGAQDWTKNTNFNVVGLGNMGPGLGSLKAPDAAGNPYYYNIDQSNSIYNNLRNYLDSLNTAKTTLQQNPDYRSS